MKQHSHDELSTFGLGQDLSEQEWRGVVRQLLAQGLLAVQGEYGILVLTDDSGAVLSGRKVTLRREAPRPSKAAKRAIAADLPGEALPLFERLRSWRADESRGQGVPAYIIFGDATLRGTAVTRPATFLRHDVAAGGRTVYRMTGPTGDQHYGCWEWTSVTAPHAFEVVD